MTEHEEPYDLGCPCLACSTFVAERERAHYEQWLISDTGLRALEDAARLIEQREETE